jgi:predicted nucleotidyltransferase
MQQTAVTITEKQLNELCQRWNIQELAIFGSALRDDFGTDSDVDLLVTFLPGTKHGLLDHVRMERELEALLQRNVDLVSKRGVEQSHNWIRRREILENSRVIYTADEKAHAPG